MNGTAVFMSLFAAFLWGTWFISLKYLRDYPIYAYLITLFTTSFIMVWIVGFILDGPRLIGNIIDVYSVKSSYVTVTVVCGILYVIGMCFSMNVLKTIGLSLSQPIQSSVNIIAGTIVSALVGGIPQSLPVARIFISGIFLMAAVVVSSLAGNLRAKAQEDGHGTSALVFTKKQLWRSLGIIAIASAFVPSYTLAISYGLKSTTHPEGLAVMPFMAMLVTGAFLGSLLYNGTALTIRKQWICLWEAPFAIHKWGIMSGLFHYGGNIIHTFATALLSAVVTWPLGVTANLWTQAWGVVYGEFKGFPRKVYIAVFSGFALYLIGAFVMAF